MSVPVTITLDPGDPVAGAVLDFIQADGAAKAALPADYLTKTKKELGPKYEEACAVRSQKAQQLINRLSVFIP